MLSSQRGLCTLVESITPTSVVATETLSRTIMAQMCDQDMQQPSNTSRHQVSQSQFITWVNHSNDIMSFISHFSDARDIHAMLARVQHTVRKMMESMESFPSHHDDNLHLRCTIDESMQLICSTCQELSTQEQHEIKIFMDPQQTGWVHRHVMQAVGQALVAFDYTDINKDHVLDHDELKVSRVISSCCVM